LAELIVLASRLSDEHRGRLIKKLRKDAPTK
jgi:hypothetical protein